MLEKMQKGQNDKVIALEEIPRPVEGR